MNFNKLIFNTQGGVINKQAVQIVSANGVMGCYEVIGGVCFDARQRRFAIASLRSEFFISLSANFFTGTCKISR